MLDQFSDLVRLCFLKEKKNKKIKIKRETERENGQVAWDVGLSPV